MARSDIERKIYNAFSKGVPDVLDSVLSECSEQKGQGIEMTENKRKQRPILKIAAVAAAVVLLLATSVTVAAVATTFSGVVGNQRAFGVAATYVVEHADSEAEKNSLANFILSGYVYDKDSEESEIELGLSGLQSVYNVKFKVGGFAYTVVLDAKTEAVLSYAKEIDESWEDYLALAGYNGLSDGIWQHELTGSDAMLIARDWFGLYDTGNCIDSVYSSCVSPNYDNDPYTLDVSMTHGGYNYVCSVDPDTGVVMNATVSKVKGYGKRHMHEVSTEFIGLYKASCIALEHFNATYSESELFKTESQVFVNVMFEAKIQVRKDRTFDSGYETDIYIANIQLVNHKLRTILQIDARTGEIISNSSETKDPTANAN